MYLQDLAKTFISKSITLLLNFAVVILTTHLWGAEGRGIISIVIANMVIITVFNNVLSGSSMSFMLPKTGLSKLILPAIIWIITLSFLGSILFSKIQYNNILLLFVITLFTSLLNMNLCIFIGKENIKWYNLSGILFPLFVFLFVLFFEYILNIKSVNSYFGGYIIAGFVLLFITWFKIMPYFENKKTTISWNTILKTFGYGWKNELSYLLQFLNYRLSYFFILYYKDIKSVGLLSVGIAIAESIWLISKSISTVQYSKIINMKDEKTAISLTTFSAKLSLIASVMLIVVLILIPSNVYGLIFGNEFIKVKQILYLLIPGIISIAFSNIYGHYFAGVNRMKILIIKSALGLFITILFSIIFIPLFGLTGACIVISLSYLVSSIYLIVMFYKEKNAIILKP